MKHIQALAVLRRSISTAASTLRSDKFGSSLIETAVVLPLYCLVYFGICQFAIFLFSYCNVTYTCRVVSRYASLHSAVSLSPASVTLLQSMVTSRLYLKSTLTPTVTVTYTTPSLDPGTNSIGNYVWVRAGWTQTLPIPFAPTITYPLGTTDLRLITR
jgi:Flp pilus assembly protein TadG